MQSLTITSKSKHAHATFVPERGAAASSIVMPGAEGEQELLYLEDAFWDKGSPDLPGGWPFCFPICGRLCRDGKMRQYLYQGQRHSMDIHGFAWQQVWQVQAHNDDSITLLLTDNESTRAQYPFAFELAMTYRIDDNRLDCEVIIKNKSKEPMPYYAGFHPYFLIPDMKMKDQILLDFKTSYRYQYNSMLTDIIGRLPALDFPCAITRLEINESLNRVEGANEFSLSYPRGDTLTMSVKSEPEDLFQFIQLYTREDAAFMCVEQWMSHPNAMNTVGAVRYLPAGQQDKISMTLSMASQ